MIEWLKRAWVKFKFVIIGLFVGALAIAFYLIKRKGGGVASSLEKVRKERDLTLKELDEINKEEKEKHRNLWNEYLRKVDEDLEIYKKENKELKKSIVERRKEILEKTKFDPNARAKEIADEFGFELVEPKDN